MSFVAGEIFFVNQEVVISIQFPKPAVKDVKVLITKVLSHDIDIRLVAHLNKRVHEITQLEVSPCYLFIVICVYVEEYTHNDGICIPVLEFWGSL